MLALGHLTLVDDFEVLIKQCFALAGRRSSGGTVQPGNSGGPLADANGDVVGVVVASLNEFETVAVAGSIPQMVNYAVKGGTLARFLRENRELVRNVKLGKSAPRSQEEAIRLVERASAMVLVYE